MLRNINRALLLLTAICHGASLAASLQGPLMFTGTCDASAAIAFSKNLFAVASDEDNILRFYRLDRPGDPVQTLDLKPLLSHKRKIPEADFEGAARIGNRVYLITSHGRDAQSKPAPFRHLFLGLDIQSTEGQIALHPAGAPYTNLVFDLSRDSRFQKYHLEQAAVRAPKTEGALNIEALTDTPNGHLLIGFRNPLIAGKALIIPLLNPNDVLAGQGPRFGDAILLDLGGLGLRGIGSFQKGYYLIGGPTGPGGECRLFTWTGQGTPKQIEGINFSGLNPEGVCFHDRDGNNDFLLLSDDGTRVIDGTMCKALPENRRNFRAFHLR